jgi:hypothetical protein
MYVIYHKETTVQHRNHRTRRENWKTVGAARAEMTRQGLSEVTFAIADKLYFHDNIEQKRVVYSIHDLNREKPIEISVNTPACLDPSTETYWSM